MAGKLTLSVSQLNEYVKRTLQMDPMLRSIELKGEISNLKFHQTGTLFFTLKDELASISCVMYAQDADKLSSMPFDGMRVVASGSVSLYVRGGQMQFYVNRMHAEGVGVLYERLLELKKKLAAEGLFDQERKRPIPSYPDTIGVVSSPTGAVIHDIIHVAMRRNPRARILLCPVRVQGIGAADEVAEAIKTLEQLENVSVIIVARGGGSIEDLWTFHEECVVRAVAACSKPVVSAVGHETDVTLCDLAADFRAPTPSAAAECVVPRRDDMILRLKSCKAALYDGVKRHTERKGLELKLVHERLARLSPDNRLLMAQKRLGEANAAMHRSIEICLARCTERLMLRKKELEVISPYHALSRGYVLVLKNGVPVRSALKLDEGDVVTLRFADEQAKARILGVSGLEDKA